MSFDITYPKISAKTEKGQIEELRSYLYQLADQLKFALKSIDGGSEGNSQAVQLSKKGKQLTSEEAQATFKSIKSLIISSADIVDAYSEEINSRLAGEYIAKSDFGTYSEKTEKATNETSKGVEDLYKSVQKITSDIGNLEFKLIEVNAHIRTGLLYYDDKEVPIYGFEVGQRNTIDGEEVFNKFARFTSDRLSFYDKNDTEVAYISDYKLYITNAQITGTLTLGRFEIDTSDGIAIKWV